MNSILYLVLPCYNEEAVLPETARALAKKYSDLMQTGRISQKSKIMFVNDGSKDAKHSSRYHIESCL